MLVVFYLLYLIQPCGKVSDNERKALLEKLREKERQRNLEELANSNSQ